MARRYSALVIDVDHDDEVDRHVRAAQAAVDAGAALSVLDDLAAASQVLEDPRLDRSLVAVRHAAFAELPHTPGHATWPGHHSDPFPDERGVPTVAPGDLTGSVIGGALVHHGCLRVDGLLTAEQAVEMRALVERAFAGRERVLADPGSDSPDWVPFEPGRERASGFGADGFVRTVDAPAALRTLAGYFARTGVTTAVTDYLGERPAMIANKWVLRCSPSGKAGTDYHQDGAFLGEGIRIVDCWIALSPCGPGTGRPAIDLVPRRFGAVIPSPPDAAFGWSLTEQAVHAEMPGAPVASPVFAPGDALFFDELLPHRTSVGLDLGERYAIESWFVAPSSYPARHVPVVL